MSTTSMPSPLFLDHNNINNNHNWANEMLQLQDHQQQQQQQKQQEGQQVDVFPTQKQLNLYQRQEEMNQLLLLQQQQDKLTWSLSIPAAVSTAAKEQVLIQKVILSHSYGQDVAWIVLGRHDDKCIRSSSSSTTMEMTLFSRPLQDFLDLTGWKESDIWEQDSNSTTLQARTIWNAQLHPVLSTTAATASSDCDSYNENGKGEDTKYEDADEQEESWQDVCSLYEWVLPYMRGLPLTPCARKSLEEWKKSCKLSLEDIVPYYQKQQENIQNQQQRRPSFPGGSSNNDATGGGVVPALQRHLQSHVEALLAGLCSGGNEDKTGTLMTTSNIKSIQWIGETYCLQGQTNDDDDGVDDMHSSSSSKFLRTSSSSSSLMSLLDWLHALDQMFRHAHGQGNFILCATISELASFLLLSQQQGQQLQHPTDCVSDTASSTSNSAQRMKTRIQLICTPFLAQLRSPYLLIPKQIQDAVMKKSKKRMTLKSIGLDSPLPPLSLLQTTSAFEKFVGMRDFFLQEFADVPQVYCEYANIFQLVAEAMLENAQHGTIACCTLPDENDPSEYSQNDGDDRVNLSQQQQEAIERLQSQSLALPPQFVTMDGPLSPELLFGSNDRLFVFSSSLSSSATTTRGGVGGVGTATGTGGVGEENQSHSSRSSNSNSRFSDNTHPRHYYNCSPSARTS